MKNKTCIYENTYWNHKGKNEKLREKLDGLVPAVGEVPNAETNPALELYRRACNCYYDLYNNGLCNLAREFETIFEMTHAYDDDLTKETVNAVENRMNRIIEAAAKEQGLVCTCNSHDDLVEALTECKRVLGFYTAHDSDSAHEAIQQAEKALAKAGVK